MISPVIFAGSLTIFAGALPPWAPPWWRGRTWVLHSTPMTIQYYLTESVTASVLYRHGCAMDSVLPNWLELLCSLRPALLAYVSCRAGACPKARFLGHFSSPLTVLPFLLYVTYRTYDVQQQQYADDTQLYNAVSPSDPRNEPNALQACLTSLQTWFYNKLAPYGTDGRLLLTANFKVTWHSACL